MGKRAGAIQERTGGQRRDGEKGPLVFSAITHGRINRYFLRHRAVSSGNLFSVRQSKGDVFGVADIIIPLLDGLPDRRRQQLSAYSSIGKRKMPRRVRPSICVGGCARPRKARLCSIPHAAVSKRAVHSREGRYLQRLESTFAVIVFDRGIPHRSEFERNVSRQLSLILCI